MFGRNKDKRPPNYKPMMEGGHGLWEIWWDRGPGTAARYVYQDLNVHAGFGPHIFLYDDEAAKAARDLARQYPDFRFAVKLKKG